MLITGSWDKTIRYWDTRSPTAAFAYQLPERLYSMSARRNTPVLGLSVPCFAFAFSLASVVATAVQFVTHMISSQAATTRCSSAPPPSATLRCVRRAPAGR